MSITKKTEATFSTILCEKFPLGEGSRHGGWVTLWHTDGDSRPTFSPPQAVTMEAEQNAKIRSAGNRKPFFLSISFVLGMTNSPIP